VTGQAAWYDVQVKACKADTGQELSSPQFDKMKSLPGVAKKRKAWLAYFAGGER